MYSHRMLLASNPYWTDYVSAFGATVGIVVAADYFARSVTVPVGVSTAA
jgi:hypothetical protein